jgi:HEAT repeat protein
LPQGLSDSNRKKELESALAQAQQGDFSGLDTIVDALTSENGEVRIKAAYYCQRIGFSAAIEPLSRMALDDPVSDNRNQAIFALVGIGRAGVVPVLISALDDEDVERREDARVALYNVLGKDVLSLLGDEEGGVDRDLAETLRLATWWETHAARFEPERVYSVGELASPGTFIGQLKAAQTSLPDAILDALCDWTGEDFGNAPLKTVITKWERWWSKNSGSYEPGRRHFFGHVVP